MARRSSPITVFALAAVGCCGVLVSSAHAYNFLQCRGANIGVSSNIRFVTDICSIPVGSVAENDVLMAMASWNGLQGMADRLSVQAGTSTSCAITHGDGQNDLARVPGSNKWLSGANGVAVFVGVTKTPQTCDDSEWDVLLNDTGLNQGAPDELTISAQPQRGAIAHELGHVLGLDHESSGLESIMAVWSGGGVSTTGPYGGRTATGLFDDMFMHAPHADDARFGYDIHGDGGTSSDVAPNAWMRSGNMMIFATTQTNLVVCDGDTVANVSWTWHNRGNLDITARSDWEIVLSTDEIIDTSDMVVLTGWATGPRGGSTMRTDTFVVPEGIGTATGLILRVGVIADPNDTLAESIESNNSTRLPMVLTVLSC